MCHVIACCLLFFRGFLSHFFDVLYGSILFFVKCFVLQFLCSLILCVVLCPRLAFAVCFSLSPHRTTLNESMSDAASQTVWEIRFGSQRPVLAQMLAQKRQGM